MDWRYNLGYKGIEPIFMVIFWDIFNHTTNNLKIGHGVHWNVLIGERTINQWLKQGAQFSGKRISSHLGTNQFLLTESIALALVVPSHIEFLVVALFVMCDVFALCCMMCFFFTTWICKPE